MDRLKASENHVAGVTERISSAYVPPLQLTKGQPPPIAANGGLSYMAFDRDGDAGTAAAMEAALRQIAGSCPCSLRINRIGLLVADKAW